MVRQAVVEDKGRVCTAGLQGVEDKPNALSLHGAALGRQQPREALPHGSSMAPRPKQQLATLIGMQAPSRSSPAPVRCD